MQVIRHYRLNIRKIWELKNLILSILRVLIIRKWTDIIAISQLNIVYLRILFLYHFLCFFNLIQNFIFFILNFQILLVNFLLILIVFLNNLLNVIIYLLNLIWNLTWETLKILLLIKAFFFVSIRCFNLLFITVLVNITASLLKTLPFRIFNILTWSLFYIVTMQVIREMGITSPITLFWFKLITLFGLRYLNLLKLIDACSHRV